MSPSRPEDALVERAQSGDVAAFESLVGAHLASLRRFARAFAPGDADADDLAQEALIKAYRSLGSYRGGSAFSTWLYAILRNVCIDATRSRAGRARAREVAPGGDAEAVALERAGTAPGSEELLLREEERRGLWAAIGQLPAEFRAALVLCDIEGFGYEEIAAVEAVPLGTVKSRVSRAREQLRRILDAGARSASRVEPAGASPRLNGEGILL